ncbi:uncharacterized protein LOC112455476, partial [Temnothorax curvispinosus]|uniref:Uncharacterized protein LOC112455476 n=1 Tax=Temnothorax curvispinosus TaxID=300111 RepID=A0A6J1PTJ0_9HYME
DICVPLLTLIFAERDIRVNDFSACGQARSRQSRPCLCVKGKEKRAFLLGGSGKRIFLSDRLPELHWTLLFLEVGIGQATTANSQIHQNQNENFQHPDNETAQLILKNLSSPNELIAQDTFRLLEDNRDREELRLLLRSWNQEELVDHLLRENVVIKILKIIKQHHIEKLLKSFDLGTQILFEDNLEKWRNSLNLPLETPNMNFSNLSGPPSPALSTESDVPSTSRSHFSPYRRSSTPSDETTDRRKIIY